MVHTREAGQQNKEEERPFADSFFFLWDIPGTLQGKIHLLSSTTNVLQVVYHIWQLQPRSTQHLMLPRTVNSGLHSLLCVGLSDEIF